ncbi:MAG: Rv3654c family TadE-like protein [Nostocoides sp.]
MIRGTRQRLESERGSGTVLITAVIGVVLTLTYAGSALVAAALAAARAQTAADLASLSGATAASLGREDACSVARRAAQANGATPVECRERDDGTVTVRVHMPVPVRVPGGPSIARGHSRAGPASAGG